MAWCVTYQQMSYNTADSSQLPSPNQDLYERFSKLVHSHCDIVMQQSDMTWRDAHYAASLYNIRAMSIEVEKHNQAQSPENWLKHSVLDTIQPIHTTNTKRAPPPLHITSQPYRLSSSSSNATTFTSPRYSEFTSSSSNNTSPTTASSSPQDVVFPRGNRDTIYCRLCGDHFTGSSRLTNLQRHVRIFFTHFSQSQN